MARNKILMLLYPFSDVRLNDYQCEIIKSLLANEFKDISVVELDNIFNEEINYDEVKKTAASIKDALKLKYFKIAKDISEIADSSKEVIAKLALLAKALNINSKDTGFDFNIFNTSEINHNEFQKTVQNFSMIASVIGFVPFLPVSDYFLLSGLQLGMIAKIANIYSFKIDPKHFLKMISGMLGAGLIFKIFSKLVLSFTPIIGWFVNASIAFAGTYAIAILTKRYIEVKGEISPENIKELWDKSFKEGKKEFWILKDYILKKKDELTNELLKFINPGKKENSDKAHKDQNVKSETALKSVKNKPNKDKKTK